METGGRSRWQSDATLVTQVHSKYLQTPASGSALLLLGAHGKEGVDGSSPSEGFSKAPQNGAFSFELTCTSCN
jgi:hypothetical protein